MMKRFLLPVMFTAMTCTAFAEECSNDDFVSFCETKTAILRLLSYPAYTGADEKVLNRAGDMAALAVIRSLSMEDFNSEKARQILLILNLAFAAPQLIEASTNRRPTAAMLLLDHLKETGRQSTTEIENTRFEIQHNTSTGRKELADSH